MRTAGLTRQRPLNREVQHPFPLTNTFFAYRALYKYYARIAQDQAIEFIKTKKYGNLALCGKNQPYCIPIAYTHTDAALLFYQSSRGRALEYLEENQRACFEIHDINDFRK